MKIAIVTLGCKVNQAESAALERRAAELGYSIANVNDADMIIVNTCAVTAEAARKSRQTIRKLQSGGTRVYVTGCYSKIDKTDMAELNVELLENSELSQLADLIKSTAGGKPSKRSRALLKIQDGCDNYCSYCIIPYARGRCRSIPPEQAIAELKHFASDGISETIITGIEIASYGKDLPAVIGLPELIKLLSTEVPNMRLQLGSLEPRVITRGFCETLAGSNIVKKFHLSLQSGSDSVLKRMNRRYTSERFAESVTLLREYFPSCFISADVIVGFPGETDMEFQKSYEFVRSCRLNHVHVFPYSPRPGTKASEMPDQLTNVIKHERSIKMQSLEGNA